MYNATFVYGSMHSIRVLLEGQGSRLVEACGQGEALDPHSGISVHRANIMACSVGKKAR